MCQRSRGGKGWEDWKGLEKDRDCGLGHKKNYWERKKLGEWITFLLFGLNSLAKLAFFWFIAWSWVAEVADQTNYKFPLSHFPHHCLSLPHPSETYGFCNPSIIFSSCVFAAILKKKKHTHAHVRACTHVSTLHGQKPHSENLIHF